MKNAWPPIRSSLFDIHPSRHCRALTMVELLIVIIVIGILVSAILVASSSFVNKGRANNTQAMLQVVSDAVEQFKRDQTAKPTISSARQAKGSGVGDPAKTYVAYADRYGAYPPDELEVFTSQVGLPGSQTPSSLAPGKAAIGAVNSSANAPWGPLRFYKDGTDGKDEVEHRDMLALVVAVETLSEAASAILDRIPDRNRTPGPLTPDGKPAVFLDRPGGDAGNWDAADLQIRYIVDDWGIPISYLSQRDWKERVEIKSKNHDHWNEASTELIRLNGGAPVIFSYGPNGKDQLTKEAMESNAKASLVGDFEEEPLHGVIDNPLNDDNVYANPALREKLAKGLPQQ